MFKKRRDNLAQQYKNDSFFSEKNVKVFYPPIGIPLVFRKDLAGHLIYKREALEE
jgi:hypothetical protein